MLVGCDDSNHRIYSIRVKKLRCIEGFQSFDQKNPSGELDCKGKYEEADTILIKLYPENGFGIVRNVKQDKNNFSVDLYKIDGCIIWDEANWICNHNWTSSDNFESYYVKNGKFSISYYATNDVAGALIPKGYSGRVTFGIIAWFQSFFD
jgi:hypothetical protein